VLDVKALVAAASGGTAATAFPVQLHREGSVADGDVELFSFKVADPSLPIAAMVTINGGRECVAPVPGGCEWSPDLDAFLLDAAGNVLAHSQCPEVPPDPAHEVPILECGIEEKGSFVFAPGRQETLRARTAGLGEYLVAIMASGKGGSFTLDISNALAPDPEPQPEPEPEPIPPPTPEPRTCNGIAPTFGCTVNGATNQLCLGTSENDVIVGTSGIDVIVGFSGNDTLAGGPGPDLLCGGSGNDTLLGSKGADQLFGEDEDDILKGGRGADALNGGAGNDGCTGGFGSRDGATDCETVSSVP
jgi:hypothetical protein